MTAEQRQARIHELLEHMGLWEQRKGQAQQTLGLIGMVPLLPVVVVPILSKEFLANLTVYVNQMKGIVLVLIAVGIFAVIDLGLIALAMKRFQRSKLILD